MYFSPFIDANGIHTNTFADIQNNLISQAQSIFGADIYLGNDSQDMQMIANEALYMYNLEQLAVSVYNNQSPTNASGTGLDSIVKTNGLVRMGSTYSTCLVTVSGIASTTIPAGIVQDSSGYKWDLPLNSVIPSGGVLSVLVTCETPGAIVADVGTINVIATPQYGWTSVSNVAAATPGTAIETDAALKARQASSVASPSSTILDGIIAAVESVSGVMRVMGYENDTSSADANGAPANSIYIVAEGGADASVSHQIYLKKTPGAPTYGTTTVNETSSSGFVTAIKFYRPTYVPIDVTVNVKGLTGYSSAITSAIQADIVAYLNSLAIGADVYISSLWGATIQALTTPLNPAFYISSVTAARHGGSQAASNITLAFNEVAQGVLGNVTVVVS